ncbi:MAG: hypothetical protein ACE5KC_04435 [Candidatus Bathyarchaeia archaeon]
MSRVRLGVSLSSQCGGGKSREEALKREGWKRQFTTDEPRLSEAVELYRSLGYEVRLEPAVFNEENELCRTCIRADCRKYKTIYIRRKASAQE